MGSLGDNDEEEANKPALASRKLSAAPRWAVIRDKKDTNHF